LRNVEVQEGRVEAWYRRGLRSGDLARLAELASFVSACGHLLRAVVTAAMKGTYPGEGSGACPPAAAAIRHLVAGALLDAERHLVLCRVESQA